MNARRLIAYDSVIVDVSWICEISGPHCSLCSTYTHSSPTGSPRRTLLPSFFKDYLYEAKKEGGDWGTGDAYYEEHNGGSTG